MATGDGFPDLITAPGAAGGPRVRVLDAHTGNPIPGPPADFWTFEQSFTGGVQVAAADVTGDGKSELVVGAGPGGGPRVRVFDLSGGTPVPLAGPLGDFFAYDTSYRGGVNVGTHWKTGDVTGDGVPDVVTGPGAAHAPTVKVYNGLTGRLVRAFAAFDAATTTGVRVGTAYVTDDIFADVVAATAAGAAEDRVRVLHGWSGKQIAGPVGSFAPLGAGHTGGLYVAASNDPPPNGSYPMSLDEEFGFTDRDDPDGNWNRANVSESVIDVSDDTLDIYRWEYTVANLSLDGPENPDLLSDRLGRFEFNVPEYDAPSNFVIPDGWALDVQRNPATGGASLKWSSADGLGVGDDPITFGFNTPPRPLVDGVGMMFGVSRVETTAAGGQLVTPGKMPTIFATGNTLIPVNANNDNGSAWKSANLPFIPSKRDFDATNLPVDDPQLVPVTVTIGGRVRRHIERDEIGTGTTGRSIRGVLVGQEKGGCLLDQSHSRRYRSDEGNLLY